MYLIQYNIVCTSTYRYVQAYVSEGGEGGLSRPSSSIIMIMIMLMLMLMLMLMIGLQSSFCPLQQQHNRTAVRRG